MEERIGEEVEELGNGSTLKVNNYHKRDGT